MQYGANTFNKFTPSFFQKKTALIIIIKEKKTNYYVGHIIRGNQYQIGTSFHLELFISAVSVIPQNPEGEARAFC